MSKKIYRVVLTGGPASGKTTLISRILKEFKQDDGWRVITIPETATELISGFGINPFGVCMSMLKFQDFVIADQIHKEKLALAAAEVVPEDKVLIVYDRALLDDKAYISDEEFAETLMRVGGKTESEVLAGYDAVIYLVTCAKGAEFAYNLGNTARSESIEYAREIDDRTLRAWSSYPDLRIIDNSVDFKDKLDRAIREIYRAIGEPVPMRKKRKYLVSMPDIELLKTRYRAAGIDMVQTYLAVTNPSIERRIRRQKGSGEELYFYTEKHSRPDGTRWVTEKRITEKEYGRYMLEADSALQSVSKTKYRFVYDSSRVEIDVYPFSSGRAVMFLYSEKPEHGTPPEISIISEVTGHRTVGCLNYQLIGSKAVLAEELHEVFDHVLGILAAAAPNEDLADLFKNKL